MMNDLQHHESVTHTIFGCPLCSSCCAMGPRAIALLYPLAPSHLLYEAQGLGPTPSLASSHHVITESLMEMDGVGCKHTGHTHFTVIYCKRKIAKVSHPVVTERLRVRIASDTRSFMGRRRRRRRRCQGRLMSDPKLMGLHRPMRPPRFRCVLAQN